MDMDDALNYQCNLRQIELFWLMIINGIDQNKVWLNLLEMGNSVLFSQMHVHISVPKKCWQNRPYYLPMQNNRRNMLPIAIYLHVYSFIIVLKPTTIDINTNSTSTEIGTRANKKNAQIIQHVQILIIEIKKYFKAIKAILLQVPTSPRYSAAAFRP